MPENWRVITRDPSCGHDAEWFVANRQGWEMCMNCLRLYCPDAYDFLTGAEDRRKAAQGGVL